VYVLHSIDICVCVLHSLEWYCVCTAHSRVVLCVYCTLWSGTLCVLHSLVYATVDSTVHTRTEYVHINRKNRTIPVILAKLFIELPDNGFVVIRIIF